MARVHARDVGADRSDDRSLTHDDGVADTGSWRARGDEVRRWLGWFALAVIVGMQAGTVFKPLGSVGSTRVADWIDLLTPFAVLGCAAMVLHHAGAQRAPGVVFFVGGTAFALGHGLHLSANSISNVDDTAVARASIVHLWDEVASHYIWYAGLFLVLVALATALRAPAFRLRAVDGAIAVAVAITLVNTYIEGGVPWLGMAFLGAGVVVGMSWWPSPVARLTLLIGGVGLALLLSWGIYWFAADGRVFPEFSDVGWI